MHGGFFRGILLAILLIAIVAGVGVYAYNAGVAQGVIDSGKLVAPAPGTMPYYPYRPFFVHPFGCLGILVPLFFLFLIFGLFRMIFWRGHWGWKMHHHDHGGSSVPPMFEEWHKRAHEAGTK